MEETAALPLAHNDVPRLVHAQLARDGLHDAPSSASFFFCFCFFFFLFFLFFFLPPAGNPDTFRKVRSLCPRPDREKSTLLLPRELYARSEDGARAASPALCGGTGGGRDGHAGGGSIIGGGVTVTKALVLRGQEQQ